jgi:hypothetical protein
MKWIKKEQTQIQEHWDDLEMERRLEERGTQTLLRGVWVSPIEG